jgi:hypothetical protein
MVGEMVNILQPIGQTCTELSGESYPTLSMVIPLTSSIQTLLENYIKTTGKGSGLAFAKQLLKAIKARFPNYRKMKPNAVAMFMYPRFKAILLSEERSSWQ